MVSSEIIKWLRTNDFFRVVVLTGSGRHQNDAQSAQIG